MKTALIIALILLIVGVILVGAGWVILQRHPIQKNALKDKVYPYGIDEVPSAINITTISSRVEILPTAEDEWRVECKETEDLYHTVELIDGVLTIKQVDTTRKWYEYISILGSFQTPSITVYLPAGAYETLNIHSTSGSIKIQEGFAFSSATLKNTSGPISCASDVTGAVEVKNTSGSITVNGSVGGDLTVKNTSGSIHVLGGVNGNLTVTNGSGSIEIKNATPTSVTIKNTSGGIDLINVICTGACNVENGSGSIELERCDAASFDVRTVSGGIRGSILSGKIFDCRSTSGGVHVPEKGEGGIFKAKTTSGGIRIVVVQ